MFSLICLLNNHLQHYIFFHRTKKTSSAARLILHTAVGVIPHIAAELLNADQMVQKVQIVRLHTNVEDIWILTIRNAAKQIAKYIIQETLIFQTLHAAKKIQNTAVLYTNRFVAELIVPYASKIDLWIVARPYLITSATIFALRNTMV